jgi:hypothetical protein
MALTLSCRKRLIPKRLNFGYRFANDHHFIYGKSIPAHQITVGAGGLHIAFYVWQAVVNPVQPSVVSDSAAIYARLRYKL